MQFIANIDFAVNAHSFVNAKLGQIVRIFLAQHHCSPISCSLAMESLSTDIIDNFIISSTLA